MPALPENPKALVNKQRDTERGTQMPVIILVGMWNGTRGTLEDKIQGTMWFNVRVSSELRLALYESEFEIIR